MAPTTGPSSRPVDPATAVTGLSDEPALPTDGK
jgi:hypothetical protein